MAIECWICPVVPTMRQFDAPCGLEQCYHLHNCINLHYWHRVIICIIVWICVFNDKENIIHENIKIKSTKTTKGIFPRELKVAKVIALFKSQNSMMFNNYRPVSILPVFSKILEKLMYNRILSFINEHKLLFEYQFGFREKHGIDIALIVLLDKIMSSINDGKIVLGVYFGFK